MIVDWLRAFLALFGGIIVIVIFFPIYNQLLPGINTLFGSTVTTLLSVGFLLMVAGLVYQFTRDANPEQSSGAL